MTRAKKPTGYGSPCKSWFVFFPSHRFSLRAVGSQLVRPCSADNRRIGLLGRATANGLENNPFPTLDLYCYTLSSSFLVSGPARIGPREAAWGGLSMPRVRTFRGGNPPTAAAFSELAHPRAAVSVVSERVCPDPLCASATFQTLPPRPLSGIQCVAEKDSLEGKTRKIASIASWAYQARNQTLAGTFF